MDLLYSTLAELVHDLELPGIAAANETKTLERIRAASTWLTQKAGRFLPVTETRRYDGRDPKVLWVDPLLAVTSITDDTTTLASTDYLLYPRSRHWDNGPYSRVEIDPDASALTSWTHEADIVAIAGRWGKYDESVDTGATVANATKLAQAGTALQVGNGSLISPGMVLLIGTEQLLVEKTGARTAATSKLNGALDDTDTEATVDNGAEFSVGEVIRIDREDLRVEAIDTNVLTLTRKWNETEGAAHVDDSAISVYRTYTVKRGINGTTDADHLNGVAISRYVAPWDVNWLVRQIAGLMYKKAKSGFAGKSASAELGEIFYLKEFPKDEVQQVLRSYRLTGI